MNINLGFWPAKHARVYRDRWALKSDRYDLTYARLNERANRLANGLKARGIGRGDRVATLLFNVNEQVEVVFACAKLGAIAVPMNFRLAPAEIVHQLNDGGPAVLIHDVDLSPMVAKALPEYAGLKLRLVVGRQPGDVVDDAYEALLAEASTDEALDPLAGDDDPIFIMYTAGTTGASKGVVLSHRNVFFQVVNGWALGIDPRAVGVVLLPLFHTGGMNGSVLPLLAVGATVVLQKRWDPAAVLAAIERERVSGMVGVPIQYQLMAECPAFDTTDFSSVACLISGGGPLSDAIGQRYLARGLQFTQGYGLTEAAPGVTGQLPEEFRAHPGSVGRQCLYVETQVVDDQGRVLPPRAEGEIRVQGPNVMLGYWGKPDETAKVLRDGWLYTGDLGWMDEDGYLYLSGRKKELLISGGENIHPKEVENVLEGHPGVAEAAVVGQPDPRWTEVPVAAVVRRDASLTADGLLEHARERLARYKVPHRVLFVESLPRNAAGKLLKKEIAEWFLKA